MSVTAHDLSGKPVIVLPNSAKKGVVAFFVLRGSPAEIGYAPELKRIALEYDRKGWAFFLEYLDSIYNPEDLKRNAKAFGYAFPVLSPGDGTLRQLGQITISPETAVFSRTGKLLYHGRIDDSIDASGRPNRGIVTHDLRLTLDAIDTGKPVSQAYVRPIGTFPPVD